MRTEVLFSVLIANYNNGRYLQEAIDSVLEQTYTNWEIVIVDDKSTDNSFEIYEKYKDDKRFRFYYNEKNGDCGCTKRRCAELAKGELCGFLDPDDALMPNALEVMVKAHAEHPECSLIYSTCYRYSGDRNEDMPIWDFIGEIPEESDFLIYKKKIVSHFVSFKKDAYDKTDGIDPFFKADVDFDLYCRLEEVGEMLYIPQPLYYYRINNEHSISINSKGSVGRAYYYSIVRQLETICRRMGGPLYEKNKTEYLQNMRVLMRIFYESYLYDAKKFRKYVHCYLKAYRYNWRAFNHIRKIVTKKR